MKNENKKLFLNIHMIRSSGVWDMPKNLLFEDNRMVFPSEEKKKIVIKDMIESKIPKTKIPKESLFSSNIINRCFYGDEPIISFEEKHEISTHICRPQYDIEYHYDYMTGEKFPFQHSFFSGTFYSFASIDLRNLLNLFDYDIEKALELLDIFITHFAFSSPKDTAYCPPSLLYCSITNKEPCSLYEAFYPPLDEREDSIAYAVEKLRSYIEDNPVYMTSSIKRLVSGRYAGQIFGDAASKPILMQTIRYYLDEINDEKE